MTKTTNNTATINAYAIDDALLEGVAGGSCYEMADDSRFLNSLNGSTDRWGATKCAFDWGRSKCNTLQIAWGKLGIDAYEYVVGDNGYFYQGNRISQAQARDIAMQVTGHHMQRSEWDW